MILKAIIYPLTTLLVFFILLFVYTKLAGPIPFSVSSVTTTKSDSFQVSGEGEVNAKPDLATISLGVQASGPTVKAAQDSLNTSINAVSAAIKKLGIEDKDIQTQNYNVNPNYDFQSTPQKITGYQANTNLTVKIRQLDKVNSAIDTATTAGANQIGGVNFEVSDKTKLENEARQQAVSAAKAKAEQAAKIAGFRLGRLVNYSENFGDQIRPVPLAQNLTVSSKDTATNIEPGSSTIHLSVTLSYEIY